MKKILSLCINLVIFIISDAFAVKLVAGNRSVVKKDGVTHTISKYYVVPNDFDPNNVTNRNTTEESQTTKLRISHSINSKSLGSGIKNEDHVSGVNLANKQNKKNNMAVNKIKVSVRKDQNYVQDKVSNQTSDKIAEATESVTTEHSTKPDPLINRSIEAITHNINISSNATADLYKTSNALKNESRRIIQIATETDFDEELDNLILTKFGLEVHKSSTENIESFWKLVKLNIDSTSGNEEFMAKLDRLTRLLNIFTNLYEAAKLQKPYESMIDGIIDIFQIPFVEQRNTFESQSETSERDYDEECLRKCSRNQSKAQVGKPEGQKSSNNLELEMLLLQRRLTGDSDNEYALINPNDRKSNDVIESTEPTNSQLLEPYNLNFGVPDGYNVRSSKARPNLNHVARDNDNIQRDPKSNQTFPDSTETDDYLDDQPSTTESGVTKPWIIEDKSTESGVTDDQPLTTASRVTKSWFIADNPTTTRVTKQWVTVDKSTESGVTEDQPSTTESRATNPWIGEDKSTAFRGTKPLNIEEKSSESRASDDQPRTSESRVTKPWIIENKPTSSRVTKPWVIEDKQTVTRGTKPWIIDNKSRASDDQPRTTESRVTKPWIIEDKPTTTRVTKQWVTVDKSTESGVTEDQPSTTESIATIPWIVEDKSTAFRGTKALNIEEKSSESRASDDQPRTSESRVTKPWIIENKPTSSRVTKPWVIEDKHTVTRGTKPWIIENKSRASDDQLRTTESRVTKPWIIEDKSTEATAADDRPRTIKSRVTKSWIIEDKSPKNLPSTIKTLWNDNLNLPWGNEDITTKNLPGYTEYETTENLPRHIENKSINSLPWTIKHKITSLPWIIEDRKQLPWVIEDRKQLPWVIEDRKQLPWVIEDRKQLPWVIEDRKQLPWVIEDRKQLPWVIEDRKQLPWVIEDRKQLPWIIEDRKQLPWVIEDRKQLPWIIEDRKHPGMVQRVKNEVKKPYRIYTYVINPTTTDHEIPNLNVATKSYSLYTSQGANKDGYTDIPSYYASQDILPKTTVDNKPSNNSQLKHTKYVTTTYDTRTVINPSNNFSENPYDDNNNQPKYLVGPGIKTNNKPKLLQPPNQPDTSQLKPVTPSYGSSTIVNPSNYFTDTPQEDKQPKYLVEPGIETSNKPTLVPPTNQPDTSQLKHVSPSYDVNPSDPLSGTPQDDYQPKYPVGPGIGTNDKPELLQPAEPHINSDEDDDGPQAPQEDSSQTVFPNNIFNPLQTLLLSNKFRPINTASASVDSSGEKSDLVNTETMFKKPNINVNLIEPTKVHPASVSKASSYAEYTLPNDYHEPNYGGQTNKQAGLISTASSSSTFTNSLNDHDNPNYIRPENQVKSGFISSSGSRYPNVGYNYDEPSSIYGATPQHSGYISKASSHSEFIIPGNNNNPTADSSEDIDRRPGSFPKVAYHPEYTNVPDNYEELIPANGDHVDQQVTPVYGADLQQHSGYNSKATAHSEYQIVPNDYNSLTADNSEDIPQHLDLVPYHPSYTDIAENYGKPDPFNGKDINQQSASAPKGLQYPEYTNVVDDYGIPTPTYSAYIPQRPGYISKASLITQNDYNNPTADSSENIDQPSSVPKVPQYSEYTNIIDNYDKTPIYSENTAQRPGYISKVSTHSEYTNVPNNHNYPTADSSENIDQRPGSVPKVSQDPEYTKVVDHYDKTPIYSENIAQHPGYISKASTHSEYTNVPYNYNYPTAVNGENINQQPGYVPKGLQYPEYTNVVDYHSNHVYHNKPTPTYSANMPQRPGYISKAILTIPNDYSNPTADSSKDITQYPGFIPDVPHHPEYINQFEDYNEPTLIYGANTPQHLGHVSKASAHSDFVYVPNDYTDDDKDTDRPSLTQNVPQNLDLKNDNVVPTLFNNGPTENNYIYTLPYNPNGQHSTQPSLIKHLMNEPTEPIHIEQFKLKMAPTYRLFTLDNLIKLHDAVIKAIKIRGADIFDYGALINLKKIIKIILILAEQLEKQEGSNVWYTKIFYNAQTHRHPLHFYVYNLLRQRWLHELMLLLDKNNFDIQILQNPKIFSFLGSWQFPDYVQNFLKTEDLIHHVFDTPVDYTATQSQKHKFSTYVYNDLLDVPEDLTNYVTNKVMQSYKAPNDGIVLSIAGVEAEPDANGIINILQKYLHYKSVIEKQENVIIRDNKVEMLKHIILFLKQRGYNASTIADLIHKLYSAIYLSEGKDCQPHHPNFEKNIFDVILPVLRRSGR